jgi:DNA-binding beta-propeller fold protein YncE
MKLSITLPIALSAFALSPLSQAGAGNILPLTTTPVSGSTVPRNGDVNPYGVAFVPAGFPTVPGGLVPGDVLVSNFNNKNNLQGTGTTIVRVSASGASSTFFAGHPEMGLSTALAVLKEGFVLVGNFPAPNGTVNTAQMGSLVILNPYGQVVETLGVPMSDGPWDMTVYENGGYATAFVANALSGTVVRLDFALGQEPLGIDLIGQTEIAQGYAHAGDPVTFIDAPTGVAYDPTRDLLYVASTLDNAVYVIDHAGDRTTPAAKGRLVYQDNTHLHGALGLALAPNGHLLVTNNDAVNSDPAQPSEIVEFTPTGQFVAQYSIDASQGGAFGLAIQATGKHSGILAAVDDVTNTLKMWKISF